jgi:hypothetical protein
MLRTNGGSVVAMTDGVMELPFLDAAESRRRAQDGERTADEHASAAWKAQALDAWYWVAMNHYRFTTDLVWQYLDRVGVVPPHEPRAMAAVSTEAVKRGWVERSKPAEYESTARPVAHSAPCRVYYSQLFRMPKQ